MGGLLCCYSADNTEPKIENAKPRKPIENVDSNVFCLERKERAVNGEKVKADTLLENKSMSCKKLEVAIAKANTIRANEKINTLLNWPKLPIQETSSNAVYPWSGKNTSSTFMQAAPKTSNSISRGMKVNQEADKKKYGSYWCESCNRSWESAHSWRDYGQVCQHCGTVVMAFKRENLLFSGTKDPLKPHKRALCQKCKVVGDCTKYN